MNTKRGSVPRGHRQRQYPRIAISLPVVLRQGDNPGVAVEMFNISPGGMQVRCHRETATRLCAANSFSEKGAPLPGDAHLFLPIHSGRVPVRVKCLIAHISLVPGACPEEEVAIGVKFQVFRDRQSLRHFMAFIEEQLVPLEDFEVYVGGPKAAASQTPNETPPTARRARG
jgi:hypothetical protein